MVRNNRESIAFEIRPEFFYGHTTARHSCSVVEYFFSASDNARLAKAITRSAPSICCANTAPNPTELASVCNINGMLVRARQRRRGGEARLDRIKSLFLSVPPLSSVILI